MTHDLTREATRLIRDTAKVVMYRFQSTVRIIQHQKQMLDFIALTLIYAHIIMLFTIN